MSMSEQEAALLLAQAQALNEQTAKLVSDAKLARIAARATLAAAERKEKILAEDAADLDIRFAELETLLRRLKAREHAMAEREKAL